jgi:hypothetical protein
MTLRDGKFYNSDGQVVPLEFGNWEQISLLNARKSLIEGAFMVGSVQCLCGYDVDRDKEPNGEMSRKRHIKNCAICGNEFEFYWQKYQGIAVPAVKLICKDAK